jgi:hypothetical protein
MQGPGIASLDVYESFLALTHVLCLDKYALAF